MVFMKNSDCNRPPRTKIKSPVRTPNASEMSNVISEMKYADRYYQPIMSSFYELGKNLP